MFFSKMMMEPTFPRRTSSSTRLSTLGPGNPINSICPILISRLSASCALPDQGNSIVTNARLNQLFLLLLMSIVFVNVSQDPLHVLPYGCSRPDVIAVHKRKDQHLSFSGDQKTAQAMVIAKCPGLSEDKRRFAPVPISKCAADSARRE